MTLSVIVVSYNTKDLSKNALEAVEVALQKTPNITYEIIIVDNNSSDGSPQMLNDYAEGKHNIHIIHNEKNVGFGAANNIGIHRAHGQYILLLNTDAFAEHVNFNELISFMTNHTDVGALTVRVELPSGNIDPASHRGFPTIWRSICYFSKLEALFSRVPLLSQVFGGYHLTHLNLNTIHEIDSPAAAFYLTRKKIIDEIKGFDEAYFMYGEDVDLSYRIKQKGYKIIYYPLYTVIHHKGQSGLKKHNNNEQQSLTKKHFYEAMKIFYRTHYAPNHPSFINSLVYAGIDLKSKL